MRKPGAKLAGEQLCFLLVLLHEQNTLHPFVFPAENVVSKISPGKISWLVLELQSCWKVLLLEGSSCSEICALGHVSQTPLQGQGTYSPASRSTGARNGSQLSPFLEVALLERKLPRAGVHVLPGGSLC